MKPGKKILTALAIAGISAAALFKCEMPERQKLNSQQVHNNLVKTLTIDEGKRDWVYDDATGKRLYPGDRAIGNRTIGVGLNLQGNPLARKLIEESGADFKKIYNGETNLTENQIAYTLDQNIYNAIRDAQKFVSKKDYEELDSRAQEVLVNMSFCMGYKGLKSFKKYKQALIDEDYDWAAVEIEDSDFYRGPHHNRAERLVEKIGSINNAGLELRPWVKNLSKDIKYRVKN